MFSLRSLLQPVEIEHGGVRAVAGGLAGGIAALIAFATVDSILAQTAVIGSVTFVLMRIAGVGVDELFEW